MHISYQIAILTTPITGGSEDNEKKSNENRNLLQQVVQNFEVLFESFEELFF